MSNTLATNEDILRFENVFSFKNILDLREMYRTHGFVKLQNLLSEEALAYLKLKIKNLNDVGAFRKDFLMPQTDFSPRYMSIINGYVMNKQSDIVSLYNNKRLRNILEIITSKKIADCNEKIENIIVTTLNKKGDTHGWHVDDYPFAFIMILEKPDKHYGGDVEIENIHGNELIDLSVGDGYLLRTDKFKHRVTPLKTNSLRVILNFTYSIEGEFVAPNGTAYKLCQSE